MKYDYDFKNELIKLEGIDLIVLFNDEKKVCNVVKTNENILFFEDYSKDNILRAKSIEVPHTYRLIHKEKIEELIIRSEENNTIITNKDNNEIIIFNFLV